VNRETLEQIWRKANLRTWALLGSLCLGLFALAFASLVIRPAWNQYQQLQRSHARAQAQSMNGDEQTALEIAALTERSEALRDSLYGDVGDVPRSEIESFVVRSLDEISTRHGVALRGITPDVPTAAWLFEELPYSVRVEGSYFAVHQWLYDVEQDLRPMVVKQFEILPSRESRKVIMDLRVVAYRATQGVPG
jgi:Tfp pilus assembly protein PilO